MYIVFPYLINFFCLIFFIYFQCFILFLLIFIEVKEFEIETVCNFINFHV